MRELNTSRFNRLTIVAGAFFAMLAVILGAFAAHGLKQMLAPYDLAIFETAARYQMYHAIALLIVGILASMPQFSTRWLKLAAIVFVLGIFLFSGSLYLLALSGIKWLGAVTPLGGAAFIFGWLLLIVAGFKQQPEFD
jgi:uncharacterized membrane protein YgdD (TMEM256/DUF423 family)